MADGSIKVKPTLTYKQTQNTNPNKLSSEKLIEQGGFDITACVGSPEKPPSDEENISQLETFNDTTSVGILTPGTKENSENVAVQLSPDPVSVTDN